MVEFGCCFLSLFVSSACLLLSFKIKHQKQHPQQVCICKLVMLTRVIVCDVQMQLLAVFWFFSSNSTLVVVLGSSHCCATKKPSSTSLKSSSSSLRQLFSRWLCAKLATAPALCLQVVAATTCRHQNQNQKLCWPLFRLFCVQSWRAPPTRPKFARAHHLAFAARARC